MKDLLIIGAGPAGLSAAVYAVRAGLTVTMLEQNYMPGGQVLTTYEVDNYLGFKGINGFDLGLKFKEHAESMGAKAQSATVNSIEKGTEGFVVHCNEGDYRAKTVLVTTGAENRTLGVAGETTFRGKGVSYCATCDGAFFKNKVTAVIGGSYTAVEDAIYLSAICEKVYLVHRRDKLRAGALLEQKLLACENVEILWNTTVADIVGDDRVKGLQLTHLPDQTAKEVAVDGVFIAVGTVPQTALLKPLIELDKNGYVPADETGATTMEGLYVAGDLRQKPLRQIVTAVADGANAVSAIWNYLLEG